MEAVEPSLVHDDYMGPRMPNEIGTLAADPEVVRKLMIPVHLEAFEMRRRGLIYTYEASSVTEDISEDQIELSRSSFRGRDW